jgi:hypothetical protein
MSIPSPESLPTSTCSSPQVKKNASSSSYPPRRKKSKSTSVPEKEVSSTLHKVPTDPPPSLAVTRKKYLLKRLKVSEEDLAKAPDINQFLKDSKVTIPNAIQAMRFAISPLIPIFLELWDSLGDRDLQALPFQALALSLEMDPRHLLGELVVAIRQYSANEVLTIAAKSHPTLTRKRIQFAKMPQGYRDRDRLDEILGAIKPSAGSTFIGKYFAGTNKPMPDDDTEPEKPVDDLEFIFPDSSLMQERVQPMRQKVLEAGK